MKKTRLVYAAIFVALLFVEVCIALFVHDRFVRPYIGDVLITVLLCCLCRVVVPKGMPALPIYVFLFAITVEVAQYINILKLLGLEDIPFISVIVGTTFSWLDLLCYGIGCLLFRVAEKAAIFFSSFKIVCSFMKNMIYQSFFS